MQMPEILDMVEDGLNLCDRLDRLYNVVYGSASAYESVKFLVLAKTILILSIRWLQKNTDMFDDTDIAICSFAENDPEEDLFEMVWEMSQNMATFDGVVRSKTPSWKIDYVSDISPVAQEESKENFEKVFMASLAGEYKEEFQACVNNTYDLAQDGEMYMDFLEIRVNEKIPKFFRLYTDNKETFTQREISIINALKTIICLNDLSPFYELCMEGIPNKLTDKALITCFIAYSYSPSGENLQEYLYRPEEGIRSYLLEQMMEYMEEKYPNIFGKGNAA